MILPPSAWIFLYLIQLLLTSLALGSLTLHHPRWLAVPRLPRFLTGFCVTPFVLGVWMLLLAIVLPGAPRWLFLIPPPAMAIVTLVLYGPCTWRRLIRDYQRTRKSSGNPWPAYLVYAGLILLLVLVIRILAHNGGYPIIAHDALVYLGEALPFAQERSISTTTIFQGWANDTTQGSTHNFLFPAFLSHALITTGNNPIGYPHDYAARAAFQLTFLYMLLSVVALAGTARYLGSGALALILLLQVPQFEYISIASSRDAFRIIPLVLLAVTLSGLSPPRLRRRLRFVSLLPPLIMAAFSLSGHTLGGFIVVTMVLAWLAWGMLQKTCWLNLALVLGAICVGLLLSGFHYLVAYIETGQFWGYSYGLLYAMEGTPLEEAWYQIERYHTAAEATMPQRLAILAGRDQYRLSILGLLAAILALIWWARFRQEKRAGSIPFIGLVALAALMPVIGAFDYKDYQLSQMFISNFRYQLHWYPFAAVCLAMLIGYWYHEFASRDDRRLRIPAALILVSMAAVASFSAYQTISSLWRTKNVWDEEWVSENVRPLEAVAHQMPAGKRLLLEEADYNYYLNNQAIVMYSRPTWEVIQATNESEVQDAFKKLSVGAVVLLEDNISGWWDRITLFNFLSNPQNAFEVNPHNSGRNRIYIVDETLVRHLNELDEAATRKAMAASLLRLDSSVSLEIKGDRTYMVAEDGQKVSVKGTAHLADGLSGGPGALVVDETTKTIGPTSGIDLSRGSLSIWARLTDLSQEYSTLVRVNNNDDLWIYRYTYDQGAAGQRMVVYYNGVNLGSTSVAITDDEWHHYVFTWQDGEQRFYIDGLEVLSAEVPASTADTRGFAIGWLGNRDGMAWEGLLANLITFNRPLTFDEIMAFNRSAWMR